MKTKKTKTYGSVFGPSRDDLEIQQDMRRDLFGSTTMGRNHLGSTGCSTASAHLRDLDVFLPTPVQSIQPETLFLMVKTRRRSIAWRFLSSTWIASQQFKPWKSIFVLFSAMLENIGGPPRLVVLCLAGM